MTQTKQPPANPARFSGANFLDLRGLGVTRTLVLENGRRHVSGQLGSAAVDVNTISLDLVRKVDIVTGGASAIYGSDAVSGVVNLVLDDRFEGLRLRGQAGVSGKGDAESALAAVTWGARLAGGRGRLVLSADHERRAQVYNGDRGFARFFDDYYSNPRDPGDGDARSNGIPDQVLVRNARLIDSSTGGTVINPAFDYTTIRRDSLLRFQPDGSLRPADIGRGQVGSGFFTEGGDGTNFRESFDLLPRLERYGVFALSGYEISDALDLYGEAKFVAVEGENQSDPSFNCDFCFGASGPLPLSLANPFLTPTARAQLQSIGFTDTFTLNRDSRDLGPARRRTDREVWRVVAGARGRIAPELRYDASLTYGRNAIRFDRINNRVNQRFLNAIDAVRDDAGVLGSRGAIVCRVRLAAGGRSTGDPDVDQCVPVNLFGDGAASPAAAYITTTTSSRLILEQQVATAYLSGDTRSWFKLPGGPIGFAAGVEYRREESRFRPDAREAAGLVYDSGGTAQRGAFKVREAFAELSAPLLRDRRWAHALLLDGSYRVADYSQGRVGMVDSWRVGAIYAPTADLSLRIARSRAVRAPNIAELFSPISDSAYFLNNGDPCSAENIGTGSTTRAANCRSLGVPAGFVAVLPSISTIPGVTGGNLDLDAETSDSFTAGGTFTPRFIPGFRLAIDYFNIRIDNAIKALDAETVLAQCVDGPELAPAFCNLITRNAGTFELSSISTQSINISRLKARGIDFDLGYTRDLTWGGATLGRLSLRLLATRVLERTDFDFQNRPDLPNRILGELGDPRWTGRLSIDWNLGNLSFGYRLRYVGDQLQNGVAAEDIYAVGGEPARNPDSRAPLRTQGNRIWG